MSYFGDSNRDRKNLSPSFNNSVEVHSPLVVPKLMPFEETQFTLSKKLDPFEDRKPHGLPASEEMGNALRLVVILLNSNKNLQGLIQHLSTQVDGDQNKKKPIAFLKELISQSRNPWEKDNTSF